MKGQTLHKEKTKIRGKKLSSRRPKINPKEREIMKRLREASTPLRDRFIEDL